MKKLFRIVGIIILFVILIPLIAGLFVKKDYLVEKEVVVDVSCDEAFSYVVLLKHQDAFGVWRNLDPEMMTVYKGTDGTVGFVYSWESKIRTVGKGEQEITGIEPNERIDYEMRFFKPFKAVADSWITLKAINDSTTKIVWGMSGSMAYPFNSLMLLMDFENTLGRDFDLGLIGLKEILEVENR